ncbi:hypothetical protein T07_7159, partial [Trichinella nelsoni]
LSNNLNILFIGPEEEISACPCSVVVITSALHAEGPWFEPRQGQLFGGSFESLNNSRTRVYKTYFTTAYFSIFIR